MHRRGGVEAHAAQVVAFQDVQDLADRGAARRRRRRRQDRVAAIGAGQRRRFRDAIGGEVGGGDDAAAGLRGLLHRLRDARPDRRRPARCRRSPAGWRQDRAAAAFRPARYGAPSGWRNCAAAAGSRRSSRAPWARMSASPSVSTNPSPARRIAGAITAARDSDAVSLQRGVEAQHRARAPRPPSSRTGWRRGPGCRTHRDTSPASPRPARSRGN